MKNSGHQGLRMSERSWASSTGLNKMKTMGLNSVRRMLDQTSLSRRQQILQSLSRVTHGPTGDHTTGIQIGPSKCLLAAQQCRRCHLPQGSPGRPLVASSVEKPTRCRTWATLEGKSISILYQLVLLERLIPQLQVQAIHEQTMAASTFARNSMLSEEEPQYLQLETQAFGR